jgi:hypothetical protein
MLQDDLNQMMGVAKNADGSSGSAFSVFLFVLTVRAALGRLSALSVFHSKSLFYGAFICAQGA